MDTKASSTAIEATTKRVDNIITKHNDLRNEYDANAKSVRTTTDKLTSDLSGITTDVNSITTRVTASEAEIEAAGGRAKREYKAIHACVTAMGDIGDAQFAAASADIAKVRGEISDLDIQTTLAAEKMDKNINSILAVDRKVVRSLKADIDVKYKTLDNHLSNHSNRIDQLDTPLMINSAITNSIQSRIGSLSSSQAQMGHAVNSLHTTQEHLINATSYLQTVVTPLYATSNQTSTSLGELTTKSDNIERSINTIESTATALATIVDTIDKSLKSVDGKVSSIKSRMDVAERLAVSSKIQSLLAQSERAPYRLDSIRSKKVYPTSRGMYRLLPLRWNSTKQRSTASEPLMTSLLVNSEPRLLPLLLGECRKADRETGPRV